VLADKELRLPGSQFADRMGVPNLVKQISPIAHEMALLRFERKRFQVGTDSRASLPGGHADGIEGSLENRP